MKSKTWTRHTKSLYMVVLFAYYYVGLAISWSLASDDGQSMKMGLVVSPMSSPPQLEGTSFRSVLWTLRLGIMFNMPTLAWINFIRIYAFEINGFGCDVAL